MSVFNALLKSIKASVLSIGMYFLVFAIFGNISARATVSTQEDAFRESVLNVAIVDEDHSALSQSLVDYLNETQHVVDPQTTSLETMNDNVRFGVYNYVLLIPEGFSEAVAKGDVEDAVEYIAPGSFASEYLLTENIRTYLQDIVVYLESGYAMDEAIAKTGDQMEHLAETKAEIMDTSDANHRSFYTGMFSFNGYSLLMILCISIGNVMLFIQQIDVNRRIAVSGMSFRKRNFAIIAAVAVIGVVTTLFIIGVVGVMGASDNNGKLFYYGINTFALMFVGLGMGFLLSSITLNENLINMLANMINLSMSFLCGVFVRLDMLSPGIKKGAHFLPLYWYTTANEWINDHPIGEILNSNFYSCLGIQLLFAAAFLVVGLIISKKKEQYAV